MISSTRADDACVAERTGLHHAIADFATDLVRIRERLDDAPPAPPQPGEHPDRATGVR